MRATPKGREMVDPGNHSFLQNPEHSYDANAVGTSAVADPVTPLSPFAESRPLEGSRSIWVYYPQGLLRRPLTVSDLNLDCIAGTRPLISSERRVGRFMNETHEKASYPGHSLFQESFFFCTIKNIGHDSGVGDIYVETVVDSKSWMSFAKVYSERNAMNAVDLLVTRVAPFFKQHGVAIERVFTRKTVEYWGLAPAHPFETFLASSRIQHMQIDPSGQPTKTPCEKFYRVLQREFFSAALRKRFHQTLSTLQQDLDAFLETYNSQRTGLGVDPQDRPPLWAFLNPAQS